MNSSSSSNTYMKMQNQLLNDDDCACFLVEAIAKKSQDINWVATIKGQRLSHNRIRRVSIDKFYEIVTGQSDAFYKICMQLPGVVDEVIREQQETNIPEDIVFDEIKSVALGFDGLSMDMTMILSMYMLGFRSYNAFDSLADNNNVIREREND